MSEIIPIVSSVSDLPSPPDSWAAVQLAGLSYFPSKIEIELWADVAASVTLAEIRGAIRGKLFDVGTDDVDTVDFASNELDLTAHAFSPMDGPIVLTTSGTLPTGLALSKDYWLGIVGVNSVQLYESFLDALLKQNPVEFTDVGSGTHTLNNKSNETERVRWMSSEILGHAGDGAVDLTADDGYVKTISHHGSFVAYALTGATDAAMSATIRFLD